MGFEGITYNDKFIPGYDKIGNRLTELERKFDNNSPSEDTLSKLNPNNIDEAYLKQTNEYLSKFSNDKNIGTLILSLKEKIGAIIDNSKNSNKNIRLATMQAANDDVELLEVA